MTINQEIHRSRPWRVNDIASDFTLWDVWEVPIVATNSDSENFLSFYSVALEAFGRMQKDTSLTGFLFALRNYISRIVPLDRNVNTLPIPGCSETSVKSRLTAHDIARCRDGAGIDLDDSGLGFRLVYLFDEESLHELSNDTVHGLMHLGWIKTNDGHSTATLAVYVIPRGIMGRTYLGLIKPFRHLIVYPAMMKAIGRQWREYLAGKNGR